MKDLVIGGRKFKSRFLKVRQKQNSEILKFVLSWMHSFVKK